MKARIQQPASPALPRTPCSASSIKMHLAVGEERRGGGYWTGTLCGRESSKGEDGKGEDSNCTEDHAKVTCKLCLGFIADVNHWRHRRFILQNRRYK